MFATTVEVEVEAEASEPMVEKNQINLKDPHQRRQAEIKIQ